jgi:hypothetical protein
VQSPQPISNLYQTQNKNQLFLQKVFINEVAGLAFLLLKTRKIKLDPLIKQIHYRKACPLYLNVEKADLRE